MSVGDLYEFRIFSTCQDQVGMNVLHYKVSTETGTFPPPSAWPNTFMDNISDDYCQLLNTDAALALVLVQLIGVVPPGPIYNSTLAPISGTGGDGILPKQVSGLIAKKTQLGGKANHGRIYIPFPYIEADGAGGKPVPDYLANLGDLGDLLAPDISFGTDPNTVTLQAQIYHRESNTTTPWTSCVVRSKWATQRRRGDFGKQNVLPL